MVRSFTLDTNCIIAVDEQRAEANAIRTLAHAHASGTARVAIVAISASERQRNSRRIKNFTEFQTRITSLGLGHLEILLPMGYWDITFWDQMLWVGDEMEQLEKRIHDVLFPEIEFSFLEFCQARGMDKDQIGSAVWRNAKCDVQALWSHIHHCREFFVTSDRNFHTAMKKPSLIALGANEIVYPAEAASLI